MDELLDIDQWLVTPENPSCTIDGMDHERCAALHNYLIQYAWVASNRDLGDFESQSWFEKHGDEANEIRERLEPSLVKFLESVYDSSELDVSLFYWVSGLNDPDAVWENWEGFAEEGEEYRRMTLYRTNTGLLGSHTDGLCYDQKLHKAVVFISIDDHDFAHKDADAHLWYPLEIVLSNWILTLRMGKITADLIESSLTTRNTILERITAIVLNKWKTLLLHSIALLLPSSPEYRQLEGDGRLQLPSCLINYWMLPWSPILPSPGPVSLPFAYQVSNI